MMYFLVEWSCERRGGGTLFGCEHHQRIFFGRAVGVVSTSVRYDDQSHRRRGVHGNGVICKCLCLIFDGDVAGETYKLFSRNNIDSS